MSVLARDIWGPDSIESVCAGCGEEDAGEVISGELVVSGCDAAEILRPASHSLDGQRHDSDTDLIDLNARWYDPVIRIFVNPDDYDRVDAATAVAGGAVGWRTNPVGTNR